MKVLIRVCICAFLYDRVTNVERYISGYKDFILPLHHI